MKTTKLVSLVLSLALTVPAVVGLTSCGNTEKDKFTVGICQLVEHDALDAATKGFRDALVEELGEDKVTFIEQKAEGESTLCTTIVNDFVNKKVDLILANATPALQAAANATLNIPILGTAVTEYGTALGIENFTGTVGGNISGTSDLASLEQQANMIPEWFPEAKTVGILYCSGEANSLYQVNEVKKFLEAKNLTVSLCAFSDTNDVAATATACAAANDVIYIPTDNTAATCAATIAAAVGTTPIIAGEENITKLCGVATLTIDYYELGKTTGKMAAKILRGEANISEMPIEYAAATKKFNAAKCEELGITPVEGYEAIN